MRHLVRWHTPVPDAPDVRTVAVAAALAMAFVALPPPGLVADAPSVSSTPVAPTTDFARSTGPLEASSLAVRADVRWRVVKPVRPTPSPVPATVIPGCAAIGTTQLPAGDDSVSRAELAALQAFAEPRQVPLALDPGCGAPTALITWYVNAEEVAVAEQAGARAEARREARLAAARAERQAAAQRAAARRRAQARARKLAAQQAARRAAVRRSAGSTGSAPSSGGWHNAPIVTWYGPGFYGNRTACGVPYTRTIVGVAHRTLPCGTLVRFRWHGITAVAPVIDRGPYAGSAYVFDFSAALACEVFKPSGIQNACFTRHDVKWQVVGRVDLKRYLATH